MKAKNKAISLLLALVLVFTAVAPSFALTESVSGTNGKISVTYRNTADTNKDGEVYYVALGDSIGTGFGTEHANKSTTLPLTTNMHACSSDAYAYQIAEKLFSTLKENGLAGGNFSYYTKGQKNYAGAVGDSSSTMTGFGWSNCSVLGYSAQDYYYCLNPSEDYESFFWGKSSTLFGVSLTDETLHNLIVPEVQKADIITIHLGSNDLFATLLGDMVEEEGYSQELRMLISLTVIYVSYGETLEDAIEEATETLETMGYSVEDAFNPRGLFEFLNVIDPENLIALFEAYVTRGIEYCEKIAEYIHTTLNPTAEIIIVGASAPFGTSLTAEGETYDIPSILARFYENAYEVAMEDPIEADDYEAYAEAFCSLLFPTGEEVSMAAASANYLENISSYDWENLSIGSAWEEIISQIEKARTYASNIAKTVNWLQEFAKESVLFVTDYDNRYKMIFKDRYGVAYDGSSTKFPSALPTAELLTWMNRETVYDGEELVSVSFGNVLEDGSRDVTITGSQYQQILEGTIDAEELGVIAGTIAASFVNMISDYLERLELRLGCDLDEFAGSLDTWMNLIELLLYGKTDEAGNTVIEPMAIFETALQLTLQDKWSEALSELTGELIFPLVHVALGNPTGLSLQKLNTGLEAATDKLNKKYDTTFTYVDIWDAVPNETNIDPHPTETGHTAIANEVLDKVLIETVAVTSGDKTSLLDTVRGVSMDVSVSPSSGYTATVLLDGTSASSSFSVSDIKKDHTVVASYAKSKTDSGSSSSGSTYSGSYSYSTSSTTSSTVPMSGTAKSADVSVTVNKSTKTATVKTIDTKSIDSVTDSSVKTGSVVLDFTDLGSEIDTAVLPASFVTSVTEAVLDEENDVTGFTVELTDGSIEFDEVATASLYQQFTSAGNSTFQVSVQNVSTSALTSAQKTAITDLETAIVLQATVTAGSSEITNFNVSTLEGLLTLSFPFSAPAGVSESEYVVYYLSSDGKLESVSTEYDEKTGEMTFETSHLSDYILVRTDASNCPKDSSCPLSEWDDLKVTSWYHDAIHYCLQTGIMKGDKANYKNQNLFRPSDNLTRAELVTMLWNLDGSPDEIYRVTFNDVRTTNWYATQVAWGVKTGVVEGSKSLFRPTDAVTRQEMVAMIHRYIEYKGIKVSVSSVECQDGVFTGFTDGANYNQWAKEDITWALGSGLITGSKKKNGTLLLNAKEPATRAEAAQMFMRLCQDIIAE